MHYILSTIYHQTKEKTMDNRIYFNPRQLIATGLYPFGLPTLRLWLGKRKENGLNRCIRKLGGTVVIHKDLFEEWIEEHAEVKGE